MHLILYISVLPILFFAFPSLSQENQVCGSPVPSDMPTIPSFPSPQISGYCDIYQRQLDYRERAIELDEQMKKRQENYANARRSAYQQYLQDLEQVNESRSKTETEQSSMNEMDNTLSE